MRIQSLSTVFCLVSVHSTLVGFTEEILTNVQENLEDDFEITRVGLTWVRLTSVQANRGGRPDEARPAVDVLGSVFGSEIT